MATISIDIPDAAITRVRDAFASEFGWTSESGVTKSAFAKQQIVEYVKQVTRNHEGNVAANAARKAKEDEINSVNIT